MLTINMHSYITGSVAGHCHLCFKSTSCVGPSAAPWRCCACLESSSFGYYKFMAVRPSILGPRNSAAVAGSVFHDSVSHGIFQMV